MTWKIVSRLSWLALLGTSIFLGKKWDDSQKEIELLNDRLKRVAAEAAAYEASTDVQAKAEEEIQKLQEQMSRERMQILRKAGEERELLTSGFARVLSRLGLSETDLKTLIADLPAEDRLRLLKQVTVVEQMAPSEAETPPSTEPKPAAPSPSEMPEEEAPLVPNTDPADSVGQVAAKSKVAEKPVAEEPTKKEEPRVATYTVKSGDNLTRIARRFDVDAVKLMKLNGISNANMLRIGQVLKIPQN